MPPLASSLEDLAVRNLAEVARIHHRWQPAARLVELWVGEAIYRRLGYREYGRTARWSR